MNAMSGLKYIHLSSNGKYPSFIECNLTIFTIYLLLVDSSFDSCNFNHV